MKKILIISPHYPPSNLAAVHRSRLFAQHLPAFGWEPVILTVDEKWYEEEPDWNLHQLVPEGQRIEKVGAFPVTKPRLIGDTGLRAFFQLRKKALELVRRERINFVYIPVPSYYTSLIGPYLRRKTGVKYGIDYIDPWVHQFPGAEKTFSRHWWSSKLSGYLEPLAVKGASLITGVAEGYYQGVRDRNPDLAGKCRFGAMPYGGERGDHQKLKDLPAAPYLFEPAAGKIQMVYAGAMLPKAYRPLAQIFKAVKAAGHIFSNVEFHFIGTGKTPTDKQGYNIRPLADEQGLWQTTVFEYPARIPYLDVLVHLQAASGVFILGSTEPHYTPSKVYQAVLSGKPVLAVLHQQSAAFAVLEEAGAGITVGLTEQTMDDLATRFTTAFESFLAFRQQFLPAAVAMQSLERYSAREVTRQLADLLNQTV